MSYCRITIYELLQKHGNNPYNDVFFVEADPLFHNNGNFDYNLKSSYSVISKFKLKCPMGSVIGCVIYILKDFLNFYLVYKIPEPTS